MRRLLAIAAAACLPLAAGPAPAADKAEAKGDKVEYEVHGGYLERAEAYRAARLADKTGLGVYSFMAFTDQDAFDKAFGKDEMGDDLEFVRARVGDKDDDIEYVSILPTSPP